MAQGLPGKCEAVSSIPSNQKTPNVCLCVYIYVWSSHFDLLITVSCKNIPSSVKSNTEFSEGRNILPEIIVEVKFLRKSAKYKKVSSLFRSLCLQRSSVLVLGRFGFIT